MKTMTIIADTFRECIGKKIVLAFFIASTVTIIAALVVFDFDIMGDEVAISSIFFNDPGSASLEHFSVGVIKVEAIFAALLFTIGLFMSLFAVTDLVPSMMAKGRLELYLARPISRAQLLLGKYAGGVGVVAINILYAIGGLWLVIGIKTGIWNPSFLYSAVTIVFMFAVIYSFIMLIGIFISSTSVMLIAALLMVSLNAMLAQRGEIFNLVNSPTLEKAADGLYWILPKYYELSMITKDLVEGLSVASWTPVLNSLLIAIVVLNAGIFFFSRKNC